MGRIGVEFEDVQRAAAELTDKGILPTIERVRQHLGTGSFTTLGRHLKQWRTLKDRERDRATPMPDAITEAAQGLWMGLSEAARSELEQFRQASVDQIEQQQQLHNDRIAERDEALNSERSAHQQAQAEIERLVELLSKERNEAQVRHHQDAQTHVALNEALAAARAALAEAQKSVARSEQARVEAAALALKATQEREIANNKMEEERTAMQRERHSERLAWAEARKSALERAEALAKTCEQLRSHASAHAKQLEQVLQQSAGTAATLKKVNEQLATTNKERLAERRRADIAHLDLEKARMAEHAARQDKERSDTELSRVNRDQLLGQQLAAVMAAVGALSKKVVQQPRRSTES